MKVCVVNYITRNAWHPHGQARLKESLDLVGFKGDILLFDDRNFKCITHKKTPYAFKLFTLREAQKRGYEIALWLDASFWAIRNIDTFIEKIYETGFLVQDSGYPLGQWTSDDCLQRMGIDRAEAWKTPMFSGGMMGVNFCDKNTFDFFAEFYDYAKNGHCFRGFWRKEKGFVSKDENVLGHRHDMSVGSILFKKYNMSMFSNNEFFNCYGWYQKYKTEMDLSKVYFLIEGGPRKLPLHEIGEEKI